MLRCRAFGRDAARGNLRDVRNTAHVELLTLRGRPKVGVQVARLRAARIRKRLRSCRRHERRQHHG
jgi:hypothetical protein